MRSYEEYRKILKLWEQGFNKSRIEIITAIPRATIRDCIKKFGSSDGLEQHQENLRTFDWHLRLNDTAYRKHYAYLLGLYLGDGHISKTRKTYRFRIFQDLKYPDLIEIAKEAIQTIAPLNKVGTVMKTGCVEIYSYSNFWVEMFPQHGVGVKHTRKIELASWQQNIVDEFPIEFLRGLYHSDGSRTEPFINKAFYPRYQFTNYSEDIRRLFCETVDKLGMKWTIYGRNITIARRADVKVLDDILGKKS